MLFRGHVGRRPEHGSRGRRGVTHRPAKRRAVVLVREILAAQGLLPRARRGPHEAEVGHLHAAVLAEQHVGRLEVAMYQPGRVRSDQAPAGPNEHTQHLAPVMPSGRHPLLQGAAGDQLHHDEYLPLVHADVVDGDHIGMGELGQRLSLAHEAALHGLARGLARVQQLDRHLAIELRIEGGEYPPGAPRPDATDHHVAADADRLGAIPE